MPILNMYGKPIHTSRFIRSASHDAGSFRDPISGWIGPEISSWAELKRERDIMQRRANDLASNNWAAHSSLNALISNSIGTGLLPKSAIPAEQLGITKEQAVAIGRQMEWLFSRWSNEADITGTQNFVDLQLLGLKSILVNGEMLHLAIMLDENHRKAECRLFSLALQAIRPQRLRTPSDLATNPLIKDGIKFSDYGKPEFYYIANPDVSILDTGANYDSVLSTDFACIPAKIAHRQQVFHIFKRDTEEQTRGFSIFAPAIALFRNLDDALNYELLSQVINASMSVFIATENNMMPVTAEFTNNETGEKVHQVSPGSVLYGDIGQKPYVLENNRPSANFAVFVELILRAMAASQGIPYETLVKDYSKTNYSSMRAALNEAWKVYNFYRQWFSRQYCQPIWEMLIEEAWLRGMLKFPNNAPDFYDARDLWCNASWIGPQKGFVDPVKEVQSVILALQNKLITYGEAWAERGGDFDEAAPIMMEEQKFLQKLGLAVTPEKSAAALTAEGEAEPQNSADADLSANSSDKNQKEIDDASGKK